MNRRLFLKAAAVGALGALGALGVLGGGIVPEARAAVPDPGNEDLVRLALTRTRQFQEHLEGDIFLDPARFGLLESTIQRFQRLQTLVGHAQFHLMNFDEALAVARNRPQVGAFPREETDFLDAIFHETATTYGFMGQKPLNNITDRIPPKEVTKVAATGNFLYKGAAVKLYKQIQRDIGPKVVLTSGVRSVPKQFLLFLTKTYQASGNLSLASRSLAPPGYSYHGIGDFDVGQVGYGQANFTARFVESEVFQRLQRFEYTRLRYPKDNLLGVRFEPWHIKVVSS
ncbi:MAG: D-alanyl-D-alanine carboxypeptidase family protein [Magnetococcales bacterium]|nr:D-alanyl-D-alanine carboxypeptidase family protein [Magnetococcales bacterium]